MLIRRIQSVGKEANNDGNRKCFFKALQVLCCLVCLCGNATAFFTDQVKLSPGTFMVGVKKNGYDAFYGVPFARPPVGDLRFRDPVPSSWWMGTFKAVLPKLYCWQWDQQMIPIPPSGTEDCLYMNIYRPHVTHKKPLNVVVFIHGGGFYTGTNNPLIYGPDLFMETKEVILVTIAYRLNVFGFLATGDLSAPGNYGLKDQTLAMKWINQHIHSFGGNPKAVTLMGQSAGSVAVHYHVLSKHSEGLFKNAVMLSGTVDTPWAQPGNPRELLNRHARALGIKNAAELESSVLVETFRKIPAKDLTKTVMDLYQWDILPVAAYLPVVEPPGSPNPFLSVHPKILMANGQFSRIPILTTVVPGDGINFIQPLIRLKGRYEEFNANMYRILPIVLEMNPNHPNMTSIVNKVRGKYFGPHGVVTPGNFNRVLKMATDYFFERPLYETCQTMGRYTPIYVHQFDYRGLSSFSTYITKTLRNYGAVHADDLLHLFRVSLFPIQLTDADKRAQAVYMRHIISFIKFNYPGYNTWDVNAPKIVRFRRSTRVDALIDRVYAKSHEFWASIKSVYDSVWSGSLLE